MHDMILVLYLHMSQFLLVLYMVTPSHTSESAISLTVLSGGILFSSYLQLMISVISEGKSPFLVVFAKIISLME